jgi:hypothetical protein
MKAAEQFTLSHASLMRKERAAAEIDRVLTDCVVMVAFSFHFHEYVFILIHTVASGLFVSAD